MKSIIMPKPVQLNDETRKSLKEQVLEVKETLAETKEVDAPSKFTAVDMWNRQKQSRSASDMMRRWNLN